MSKADPVAAATPSPFSSLESASALSSLFGCDPAVALAAVANFRGQKTSHAVEVRIPDRGPERHRADMYRTFQGGEPVVPKYVAQHFARTGTTPPSSRSVVAAVPVTTPEIKEAMMPLITDQWLHTFVKWHIEMEGICPHADSLSPVYFKLGEHNWKKVDTTWGLINTQRRATGQTGLNEFVIANGYEAPPVKKGEPVTSLSVTDHWLKAFAIWHREKLGQYPASEATTPVYFKLEQPGQPPEWIETGLHWADLNDARILNGQSSLNEFMDSLPKTSISAAREDSKTRQPQLKSKYPALTDARVKQLVEWHKEKEGHYPDRLSKTPVWTKDEAGNWLESDDAWFNIETAFTRRGRGVESPATTLRKFLKLHGYVEKAAPKAPKPRAAKLVKPAFQAAQAPVVVAQPPPPAPLMSVSPQPELTTLYLDYLLAQFRTKMRRDPDCLQAQDRVWDKDHAGQWVELPFSWSLVNTALTNRTHGVDSKALTLKGHIRRQMPEITPEYLRSLIDLHMQKEQRILKSDAGSLNQHVWMDNPGDRPYKSAIRWNLFAEHLKAADSAAGFGTRDLGVFVQRHLAEVAARAQLLPGLQVA